MCDLGGGGGVVGAMNTDERGLRVGDTTNNVCVGGGEVPTWYVSSLYKLICS